MTRKALCLALLLSLVSFPVPLPAQTNSTDPDIVRGIGQVDEGDYDAAILTLDNAARRLAPDPKRTSDLSQAYLYLGIAYLGKGHDAAARAKFREALGQIKDLTLSPEKFPPKVIDAFEAAKEEAEKNAPAAAPTTASAATTPEKKKGGSGKILLIVGGLAAAGGIAAAAGGGGSKTAAPTTTTQPPDPRKVDADTGALCCNDYPANLTHFDVVVSAAGTLDADIVWTTGDTQIFYEMTLDDDAYTVVAHSNRTTNTSSHLTASVSPRTSSPSAAYHLYVGLNNNGTTAPVPFNLTIKHP